MAAKSYPASSVVDFDRHPGWLVALVETNAEVAPLGLGHTSPLEFCASPSSRSMVFCSVVHLRTMWFLVRPSFSGGLPGLGSFRVARLAKLPPMMPLTVVDQDSRVASFDGTLCPRRQTVHNHCRWSVSVSFVRKRAGSLCRMLVPALRVASPCQPYRLCQQLLLEQAKLGWSCSSSPGLDQLSREYRLHRQSKRPLRCCEPGRLLSRRHAYEVSVARDLGCDGLGGAIGHGHDLDVEANAS